MSLWHAAGLSERLPARRFRLAQEFRASDATQVALGTGEDDSTPAFEKLDSALTKGIAEGRSQLRNDILNARRVLSGATVGAAALSIVAALAVALGLWPRLSEYR